MNKPKTISEIKKCSLIVILGHYGSGKTNLALNIALQLKEEGREPLLIDLDVVNPYFRSTDYKELTDEADIKVLGPVFGNSNLDTPSLSPGIDSAVVRATPEAPVIIDVGGDPDGARALARYAEFVNNTQDKAVVAVVNLRRPETQTVQANVSMLEDISRQAGIAIDAFISNTHLAEFTDREVIEESIPLLSQLRAESGKPLAAITIPADLSAADKERLQLAYDACFARENGQSVSTQSKDSALPEGDNQVFLPIRRLVKTVWQ